ncbi:hypothetical protein So717_38640 [Roseobacter cerasinus]|uniref:TRAP transporter small permease protein n=1 Tax=Roseobacter cerasinus TaxID=2602289 RepID=A0A640VYD3_9RHOB|nr:TRAP transporter small permease subunit [Roseobacter cerasinus]GFE52111.1 hypothetical protein So717_38640 [Roseobacter cerasinus]
MLRILLHIPVVTAAAALFLLMVMTFSDVMLRSMANAPIEQATELTRIFMAIIVFSVMPIVSTSGAHIAVDLTDGLFERAALTRLRDGLLFLICGALLFWPLQRVWVLAERARDFGDVTEYLSIPQFLVGWFIAGSLAITMIAMIGVGLTLLVRGGKS